jgi:uncharacterized protein (DUF983 family)
MYHQRSAYSFGYVCILCLGALAFSEYHQSIIAKQSVFLIWEPAMLLTTLVSLITIQSALLLSLSTNSIPRFWIYVRCEPSRVFGHSWSSTPILDN